MLVSKAAEPISKLFVFGFRWAYNRLTVDDQDSVLVDTIRLEPDPVFSGHYFNNLDLCGDGIADSHRGYKIQLLMNIDGTVTWQSISEDGRYQSGAQHTMGNAGFKEGLPSIGLIDMSWILITGDSCIQVDI